MTAHWLDLAFTLLTHPQQECHIYGVLLTHSCHVGRSSNCSLLLLLLGHPGRPV
jgi:hypothetical protein